MAQLRQGYEAFVKRGAVIIVVGPENKKAFSTYWKENDLPFIGLPDPEHHVLKAYGQEVKLLKLGRMPAQVIVSRSGLVRYVHYGDSMKDIPENQEILTLLDVLETEQGEGNTNETH